MTNPQSLPDAALEDCGIVLGRRGAGKSNALMTLFERELDAGHRAVMIDPKGDRWGIRLNPDKSPSRFTIPIFGGDHGDLPVDAAMGERLGVMVAEHDLSCLIDLSHLSLADKQRFMLGFAPALLTRNRAALTIFIEEVDQFANQDPRYQPAMLVHHIANFGTLGRQRGIVPWFASQRPAKVNATVRSQADTFVGMKVTMPLDRDAYRDWFKGHSPAAAARVEAEVGSLKPGEALAWVGATEFFEKITFPMASTYDSGRTPKHGEVIEGVVLPRIDLGELAAGLAPVADIVIGKSPEAAESYINEMSDLRGQLAAAHEQIAIIIAQRDQHAERADFYERQVKQVRAAIAFMPDEALAIDAVPGEPAAMILPPDATPQREQPEPIASEQASTDMPKGARQVIEQIAKAHPRAITLEQAAKLAGVSVASSLWNRNRNAARGSGLIEQLGDRWRLSAAGLAAYPANNDGWSPVAAWCSVLPPAAGRLLRALVDRGDAWTDRDVLADDAEISRTSSSLGNGLAELRANGLAENNKREWRATRVVL